MATHGFFRFGFDHDAGEGFGPGVANNNATGLREFGFGGTNCICDGCNLVEGLLFADADIDDDLGKDLEVCHDLVERAAGAAENVKDDERGEQSIAGGGEMWKKNVTRLFAAEGGLFLLHALKDIFISDWSAKHADGVAAQRCFEPHVGHGGSDNGVVAKNSPLFHVTCGQEHDGVAVDDVAVCVGEHGAVGIAVKGDTEIGLEVLRFGGNDFRMQSAAVGVDVAAVRRRMGEMNGAGEVSEQLGRDSGSRAIGAIQDNAKAVEVEVREGRTQELLVVSAIFLIDDRGCVWTRSLDVFEPPENLRFDTNLGFVG